ncbi:protein ALP1-like isoform X2 [Nicotiana tomentosiformis]|uniref:protein ALP1-like isoform X2 n=1 Tax=Nicotiana tomentosiformis TaxID=4098 RepID=UPI00051B0067|nr:protein ALP1-like isoform X2 [Nicotiana tomentosiformis]
MGPIRGLKRKKKADKDVDHYTLLHSPLSQPCSSDWWDGFSKRISGTSVQKRSSVTFESLFKLSRKTFNYICSLVKEEMMAKPTNLTDLSGKFLSLDDRVAVALRRLSSGDSLSTVGESLGINQSTVSQITWRFVEAMEHRALHHIHWPSNQEDMKNIKSKFENIRGLLNCCGAIDTTHIMFCLSTDVPSSKIWSDLEKNHSMLLQAIVDPDMRFLDVVAGWPGSLSDSEVLKSSRFFKLAEEGKRLSGKNIKLSDDTELREYIVGDSGFPLLPWLLTPYVGRVLSDYQADYNKRHFATRKVAQRALARLKDKWKIIQGVMWRPDKHKLPRIILVCCLLHNILIDLNDGVDDKVPLTHHHDPDYGQQIGDSTDKSASTQREKLALYLANKLPS